MPRSPHSFLFVPACAIMLVATGIFSAPPALGTSVPAGASMSLLPPISGQRLAAGMQRCMASQGYIACVYKCRTTTHDTPTNHACQLKCQSQYCPPLDD